ELRLREVNTPLALNPFQLVLRGAPRHEFLPTMTVVLWYARRAQRANSAAGIGRLRRPLAAAHALALRLEELGDVVRLAEPRRMPGGSTMLEVRLVIGRPDDAPEDAREPGGESAENTFCHPAVIVTVTSQASGATVTQANRCRPILMRIVVPTHNATAASSWFEIPNSGHSELIPPSGSTTPW